MPWTSKTATELKQDFVVVSQLPDRNMRALCRCFNISPNTACKLLHRFRAMGEEGLQNRSRRPLRTPSKTSDLTEEVVVSIRAAHPLWGARRIAQELRTQGLVKVPAPSTITAILSRRGCLHSDRLLSTLEWISAAPNNKTAVLWNAELPSISHEPDLPIVLQHLLSRRVLEYPTFQLCIEVSLGVVHARS
jgi:transposase